MIDNRNLGDDLMIYGRGDAESFFSVREEIVERHANKLRVRIGQGYRYGADTRVELMPMHDHCEESAQPDYIQNAFMLDLRVTLFVLVRKK